MDVRDLLALGAALLDRLANRPESRTPSEHHDVAAVRIAENLGRRNLACDARYLARAHSDHQLMIRGRIRNVAGQMFAGDTTDAMLQAWRAGNRPRTRERFFITPIRLKYLTIHLARELDLDFRQLRYIGHQPWLRAVGELAVGEQDNRGHILDRDANRFVRRHEAVARRHCRNNRNRRLAMTPVHGLEQVGLLGLGRHAGRRARALHVADDDRQFGLHRETNRLGLQIHARARGRSDCDRATERGADRGAYARDLVLCLKSIDVKVFVARQLMQDIARWSDRVRAEEEWTARASGRDDEAHSGSAVAGYIAIKSRRDMRLRHHITGGEHLSGLAVVPSGLERLQVGVEDRLIFLETALDVAHGAVDGALIQPRQHPEHEHIAASERIAIAKPRALQREAREPRHIDFEDLKFIE